MLQALVTEAYNHHVARMKAKRAPPVDEQYALRMKFINELITAIDKAKKQAQLTGEQFYLPLLSKIVDMQLFDSRTTATSR